MDEIKFRNHFSIILEKLGALVMVFVILLIQNLDAVSKMIMEIGNWKLSAFSVKDLLIATGILVIIGCILYLNIRIWSKTWITITKETIVYERDTWNKVKNTIVLRNVSNVNTEENILEKILGTCKLKLDTNSLSTADTTDVKIVLKKKDAKKIQTLLLTRIQAMQDQNLQMYGEDADNPDMEKKYDVVANVKDIVMHGICSINLFSILVLAGCVGGVVTELSTLSKGLSGEIVPIVTNFVIIFGIILTCFKEIFGGFITYYDFKAGRRGDRLYVHYGMFHTMDITIPVNKINGVLIHQTLIGRILHKYMVELINVGMGDEQKEAGAYLILACDQRELHDQLELLLPEFASVPIEQIKRQPQGVILSKLMKTVIYSCVIIITAVSVSCMIPHINNYIVISICVGMIGYGIMLSILEYITAGSYMDEKQLIVANGCFKRDITIMPYEKIQYLQVKSNIILEHFGISKGEANLLASIKNQTQNIPACDTGILEQMIKKIKISSSGM